jgi:hypothetical protein
MRAKIFTLHSCRSMVASKLLLCTTDGLVVQSRIYDLQTNRATIRHLYSRSLHTTENYIGTADCEVVQAYLSAHLSNNRTFLRMHQETVAVLCSFMLGTEYTHSTHNSVLRYLNA